jgi:hypothetical protein
VDGGIIYCTVFFQFFRTLRDAHRSNERIFLIDGKKRILIVSFLYCIQENSMGMQGKSRYLGKRKQSEPLMVEPTSVDFAKQRFTSSKNEL